MEKEITSVNNEFVKNAAKLQQKKFRDESKLFLLEGFKAIDEAFRAGIEIEKLFVNKENIVVLNLFQDLIIKCKSKCDLILTTEPVLKKIATTTTPPDAIAIGKQKTFSLEDIKDAKKVLLLENIKDLGNLGTILRAAKAFSQDAVVLFGETVDIYNPKCVRASVGNLWKLPIVHIKDFEMLKKYFDKFERVATLPKTDDTIFLKEYSGKSPYLIMFGAESDGLSNELIDFATKKVTIEMNDAVESLNLSVSVGVFLYKIEN